MGEGEEMRIQKEQVRGLSSVLIYVGYATPGFSVLCSRCGKACLNPGGSHRAGCVHGISTTFTFRAAQFGSSVSGCSMETSINSRSRRTVGRGCNLALEAACGTFYADLLSTPHSPYQEPFVTTGGRLRWRDGDRHRPPAQTNRRWERFRCRWHDIREVTGLGCWDMDQIQGKM